MREVVLKNKTIPEERERQNCFQMRETVLKQKTIPDEHGCLVADVSNNSELLYLENSSLSRQQQTMFILLR